MITKQRLTRGPVLEAVAVVVLLGAYLVQAIPSIDRTSLTYDEHSHLPCGYSYWTEKDFRLGRSHPPLYKLVAALPLLAMDLSTEQSRAVLEAAPELGQGWDPYTYGETLLILDNPDRFDAIVRAARRMMLVFAMILALVVFFWARQLFGSAGGLLALTLVVFNPDLLGHGPLVASDVPMAAFFGASVFLFWSQLERPSAWKLFGLGICLGAGLATRYSSLLLGPILVALTAIAWFDPSIRSGPASLLRPLGRGTAARRLLWLGGFTSVVVATCALVLWASYLFVEPPWAYVQGLKLVYGLANPEFEPLLLGEYRAGGFWSYYLVTLGLKLPLATLALGALALVHGWVNRRSWRPAAAAALVLAPVTLLIVMTMTTLQAGNRYVFGVYPFLFAGIGCLGTYFRRWPSASSLSARLPAVGIAALAVLAAFSGVRAYPFYISYANALVPSPMAFFGYLDDSNNDWHHGWREVARLQRKGELPAVAIYVQSYLDLRLRPYGIRHVPIDLPDEAPAPGVYLFSSSDYYRARKDNRQIGVRVPLLEDYPPEDVVAGCVVVLRVPEQPEPEPPAPLETREEAYANGRTRIRWNVYRDADGNEVTHGPYTIWFETGRKNVEGTYAHGEPHGPYVNWHPNGIKAEEGTLWRGALHGPIRTWDEAGRPTGNWTYWQGSSLDLRRH